MLHLRVEVSFLYAELSLALWNRCPILIFCIKTEVGIGDEIWIQSLHTSGGINPSTHSYELTFRVIDDDILEECGARSTILISNCKQDRVDT